MYSYVKGSPEIMKSFINKSFIPSNYNLILRNYTSKGYRVLAIGYKKI